jgi:hypothetical protein
VATVEDGGVHGGRGTGNHPPFRRQRGTFGGVSSGDHFTIWPRPNIGWYAEAAYEVTFPQDGTHNSIAFAAGILIGR